MPKNTIHIDHYSRALILAVRIDCEQRTKAAIKSNIEGLSVNQDNVAEKLAIAIDSAKVEYE